MPPRVYKNSHPHPKHRFLDVVRWQLGLGPRETPPAGVVGPPRLEAPPSLRKYSEVDASDPRLVQLTWIGHSTFLIRLRGRNFLTDPIFGDCGPPILLKRLRRAVPPGLSPGELPPIDDVLISHCHYDHLDSGALKLLGNRPKYWTPAGSAGWFRRRGITNVQQMEWWESAPAPRGIELFCVPAQHFAGRGLFDRNRTHWCGWVIRSPERSIYFAGDTGYYPVFKEIGARFGGFDVAMIPIGAYRPRWLMRGVHVDPREAVQIHLDVRSRQSVACHWGTFALTDEPLDEPPRLLKSAMDARHLKQGEFRALGFGETIEV
jgi:N-acyl-phosphatidylethanolamine-hydrolysing phospholipase D